MSRRREVVKIDDKEYSIKELTVQDIIDITSGSMFFSGLLSGKSKEENPASNEPPLSEIQTILSDIDRVMEKTCDFKVKDLYHLAPSDIRKLYETFQKVNSDFLLVLEKVGAVELLAGIRDTALNHFSKALVI